MLHSWFLLIFLLYINDLPDNAVLIILLFPLNLIRLLIYGRSWSQFVNLNLTCDARWTEARIGSLISKLKRKTELVSFDRSKTGDVKRNWCKKECPWWKIIFLGVGIVSLFWIGLGLLYSLLHSLKLPPRKFKPWFFKMFFEVAFYLYKYDIWQCME